MPKHITTTDTFQGELERMGPTTSRQICTDPKNPSVYQVAGTVLTGVAYPKAVILHVGRRDHEVVICDTRPFGVHAMYSWGANKQIEVNTFDPYAEKDGDLCVKRETIQPLPPELWQKELEEQFEELRALSRFGEWPQPHELNFRREELTAVYVIYSGGETIFSPSGYRRAAFRAYPMGLSFLRQMQGYPSLLSQSLLAKVINPPVPEKWGELWMIERARRALGLRPKRASEATWTDVRWRTIEVAIELGWDPKKSNLAY